MKPPNRIVVVVSLTTVIFCFVLSEARGADFFTDEAGDFITTSTVLTMNPTKATVGSSLILTSKTAGVDWAGVSIPFYVDNNLIGTTTTDGSSQAQLVYAISNISAGIHTFRADFASNPRTRTELVATQVNYRPDGSVRSIDRFFVRYHDTVGASTGSASFTATDNSPLISPLTNRTVLLGSDVTLSVMPATSALSYQWLFNGTNLNGATDARLVLTKILVSQLGSYMVIASNLAGVVTSSTAFIEVATLPQIESEPEDQVADAGGTAYFRVIASGTEPLRYQWRLNGTNIAGATSSKLVLTNAQERDEGEYTAVVENELGMHVSRPASLAVVIREIGLATFSRAAFSPDAMYVVTSGFDGVSLLSRSNGAVLRRFRAAVGSIAFSADGSKFVTWSWGSRMKLWSVADPTPLQEFSVNDTASIALSPDASMVLTGGYSDTKARLWSASDGKLQRIFQGHVGLVASVAFSPDGTKVLTGSWDGTIKLWTIDDGTLLRTFQGQSFVSSVAFSPDGSKTLAGSTDGTVKLWSASDGTLLRTFQGHTGTIYDVAFSPDGTKALTGSSDSTAKLWSISDGTLLRTFQGHTLGVWSVGFSPEGSEVITADEDQTAKLWSVADGKLLRVWQGHQSFVTIAAVSPDASKVLTGGSNDRTAKLWSVGDGTLLWTFENTSSLAFAPDGSHLLTGSPDGTAKLWTVDGGTLLRTFQGRYGVSSVAFSPDGSKALAGSLDGTALWSITDGILLRSFSGHLDNWGKDAPIVSVAFSFDGTKVLTGGGETAKLWSVSNGVLLQTFRQWPSVGSVAFSRDDSRVLTGGSGAVKLWSTSEGNLLQTLQTGGEPVGFSHDGTKVLARGDDGAGNIWSIPDGTLLRKLRSGDTHFLDFSKIAFTLDGSQVVTPWGNRALLWSVGESQPQAPALRIERLGPALSIKWPAASANGVLQSTDRLGSNARWITVPKTPLVIGDQNMITVDPNAETEFYRLVVQQ